MTSFLVRGDSERLSRVAERHGVACREQSGRTLTPGEYAAVLAARDRQRSGQARGSGSRNSSSGREVAREDPGATLQV